MRIASHATATRRRALDAVRNGATYTAAGREVGATRATVRAWATREGLRSPRTPSPQAPPLTPHPLPDSPAARSADALVARLHALRDAPPLRIAPPLPVIPRSGCDHFRMGHRKLCTRCRCAVQRGEAVLG